MTGERIVRSVLMGAALVLGVVGCPPGPPDDGDAGVGGSTAAGGSAAGTLGTGGSATGGTGGQPLPGADQFTKLILAESGVPVLPMSCVVGESPVNFSFYAASGELVWDDCVPMQPRDSSCRILDTMESSSVRAALAEVGLGASGVCVADAKGSTLDLVTPEGTSQYVTDDRSCEPPPAGRTFVTGLDALGSKLASLAALRITSSFTSLTFGWHGGGPTEPGLACDVGLYDNRITVADTRILSWDYCGNAGEVMQGSRPLVELEWNLVLDSLSKIHVGWRCQGGGAADAPTLSLDVKVGDTVVRYFDGFFPGYPAPGERNFVMHLVDWLGYDQSHLGDVMTSLTRYTTLPAVDRLTLSSYGSMSSVPAGSECGTYGGTYGFDSASGALSWDECVSDQGVYRPRRGSRSVTESERALILISLAQLAPGTADYCLAAPPKTLLVEAAGATTRYVSSDWGGCAPLPEGTFIRNLDEMDILRTLAQAT